VQAKVETAVGTNQSIWDVFRNQDDQVGFTYKTLQDGELQAGFFDFPEIRSADSTNRYVLSGSLSIGAIPTEPVDLCATPRAALEAKNDEIDGLRTRRELLQAELQHATPQQKTAIVAEIGATNDLIAQAETEYPPFRTPSTRASRTTATTETSSSSRRWWSTPAERDSARALARRRAVRRRPRGHAGQRSRRSRARPPRGRRPCRRRASVWPPTACMASTRTSARRRAA
jgi:hypothetical protein